MDIWLLIIMLVFSIIGLIMIFSASSVSTVLRYNVPQYHFFVRQAIFLAISFLAGFLIIIRFPTSKYKYLVPLATIGIIVALIGLLVYGKLTNNVRSWYDLGFFALQPSEFAKSIVIVFLAVAYSKLEKIKKAKITMYLLPAAIGGVIALLIAMQPDFGTFAILCGIIFFVFISLPYVQKNLGKVLKIGVIIALIGCFAIVYSGAELLNTRQLQRFQYKEPCNIYREDMALLRYIMGDYLGLV